MLSTCARARLLCVVGGAQSGAVILAAHPGQGASHALRVATHRLAVQTGRRALYLDARIESHDHKGLETAIERFAQDTTTLRGNDNNTSRIPVLVVDHADACDRLLDAVALVQALNPNVRVVLCGTKLQLPALLRSRLRQPSLPFVRLTPTGPTDVAAMHAVLLAHDPEVTTEAARAVCYLTGSKPLWLTALVRLGRGASAGQCDQLLAEMPNPGFPMRAIIEACRGIDSSGGPVSVNDLQIWLEPCLARSPKDKDRHRTPRSLLLRWITDLHDQGLLYAHRGRVQVAYPLLMENDGMTDKMLRELDRHNAPVSRALLRWHLQGKSELPV